MFIVFKSGKEIKITLRPKRFDEQYGETNFHFVYSTLPLQDYINYFVKDMPVAIKFKKEGSKQIFRMNFHEGWKKSFGILLCEDIKNIRHEFSKSEYAKDYKLNILVSGNEDIKTTLSNIILEEIRRKLF